MRANDAEQSSTQKNNKDNLSTLHTTLFFEKAFICYLYFDFCYDVYDLALALDFHCAECLGPSDNGCPSYDVTAHQKVQRGIR